MLLVHPCSEVLSEMQDLFLSLGYGVLTAQDGGSALELASRLQPDLVICPVQAGSLAGHQFLKQIRTLHPATMRAVLGGPDEETEAIRFLMDGSAGLFVSQPWDAGLLAEKTAKLLRLGEKFSNRQLLAVFNNLQSLPAMPELYGRLCALIERDAPLEEIARLVEQDQAVAVQLLKVANSVYFQVNTGSVRQALSFLGLTNLKTIVLGIVTLKQFNGLQGGFFSRDVLWEHADRVNRLTHQLFERFAGRRMKENEAAAGLLHDIGRILLLRDYAQPYTSVCRSIFQNRSSQFRDAEQSLMGISHDEVGGFLLNWWGLPHPIVEAAMFHHDPANPAVIHRELVAAVHVADHYAWKRQKALVLPRLNPEALEVLGAGEEECESVLK